MVEALCAHFARDQLGLAELERRLDRAYEVKELSELQALTSDLPSLAELADPEEGTAAGESEAGGRGEQGAAPGAGRGDRSGRARALPPVAVDPTAVARGQEFVAAVMGGSERAGRWTPARRITAFALMGGVQLDFRDAVFSSEEVEVTAMAVMGGVEVVVPPGVRVEVSGLAIMGGFERMTIGLEPQPEAPLIRVGGLALMGGVEVKVRLPGETEGEAKRRLKAARHAP